MSSHSSQKEPCTDYNRLQGVFPDPICPHPSSHSTEELQILPNSSSTDLSSEFVERTKFCQNVRLITCSLSGVPIPPSTRLILSLQKQFPKCVLYSSFSCMVLIIFYFPQALSLIATILIILVIYLLPIQKKLL